MYQNPHLKILVDTVKLPDATIGEHAYFIRPHQYATGVIAIEDDHVYLVKQFRYIAERWLWQIPMGAAPGRNLLASAREELKEETGIRAKYWKKLGFIRPEPGMTPQAIHIFLAQGLIHENQKLEGTELGMKAAKFKFGQMNRMIAEGRITCGYTLSAWQLYLSKIKPTL